MAMLAANGQGLVATVLFHSNFLRWRGENELGVMLLNDHGEVVLGDDVEKRVPPDRHLDAKVIAEDVTRREVVHSFDND